MREPLTSITRIARRASGTRAAARTLPEETPVALSYAGTTHAVMMASPADLEDFAVGFSLTEGVIASPGEIETIEIEQAGEGIDIQIRLVDSANTRFKSRRRRLAGRVGCGLCGIESIEEAMRSVASVAGAKISFSAADIVQAVRLLSKAQPMHAETGALARAGIDGMQGAVVITSRVSVEMVQKAAAIGSAAIFAVSAPTALAVRTADQAGMMLVALVRGDDYDVFAHPERLKGGDAQKVA